MTEIVHRACLAAVCAAAVLPAIPALAVHPVLGIAIFMTAFFVAAGHAVVFGLPLYFLLSRRGRLGAAEALFGGLAVGALPSLALVSVMDLSSGALLGDPELLTGLGQQPGYLVMPLVFGGCGLVGGLAFWLVVRAYSEGEER